MYHGTIIGRPPPRGSVAFFPPRPRAMVTCHVMSQQTPPPDQPPHASLLSVVKRARVVISVGAGGVGKTTTAAALGLLGAQCGRRTLVLTIDPARRLAVSLGLRGGLDHHQRPVPAEKMRAAGLEPGLLYAMMLDQKQTFDDLIRRQSADEQSARRVLANKLYREISTRLAGGQEYAAMEKLHELVEQGAYDLIVLDTPPTANAIDFFEAPHKMVNLIDSPAVAFFLKSYRTAGRFSFKLLSAGASLVFRRLARFVGGGFLDDVAEYFGAMHALLDGFKERAAKVIELLSRVDVAYIVVTSPDRRAVDEAIGFDQRFAAIGSAATGFVINRVHPLARSTPAAEQVERELLRCAMAPQEAAALAPRLLDAHQRMQVLGEADAAQIERLISRCGAGKHYVRVPLFDEDIYDVGGLLKLARYLR